jgi:hypothetical protein
VPTNSGMPSNILLRFDFFSILHGWQLDYLTIRSVSSLNNPQISEMIFLWNYEVEMLKSS